MVASMKAALSTAAAVVAAATGTCIELCWLLTALAFNSNSRLEI
jgi:hypothetical protein